METIQAGYMRMAIKEAEKGIGAVNPNPLVGAVIVKDGKVIGKGYHEYYGGLHAERNAIASCTESPKGASIYVTLEPCCHYGKTPPCTEAIIENEIAAVIIGSGDPNPCVAGKGIQILREHGISVVTDVLKEECDRLNPVFFHYIKNKTPYVVMKYAMTADGKISSYTGASKWITSEHARNYVQKSRHQYMGIMAGIGTVLADDPLLTCRLPDGRNPIRIICDTHLRTPLTSRLVMTAKDARLILATACEDSERHRAYQDMGCEIVLVKQNQDGLDLRELMHKLGERKIDSILLEGGGNLNFSALKAGIVNRIQAYIAPKLLGGSQAKTPVEGIGFESPAGAVMLENQEITVLEPDVLISWDVKKRPDTEDEEAKNRCLPEL